jgi:biopolymer transport protein TolR
MTPLEIEAASGSGRRRRRGRAATRAMAEINVTPFVDVMMVLLVVFMVAAPLMTVGVPLELPRSAAAPLPIDREEPLTVNIDSTGQVFLQQEPVPFESLVDSLRAAAEGRQSDRVFLRADTALDYGRVAQVMGALNAGGFRNIGLVTDPAAAASGGATDRGP